jgi:hypothetical protein
MAATAITIRSNVAKIGEMPFLDFKTALNATVFHRLLEQEALFQYLTHMNPKYLSRFKILMKCLLVHELTWKASYTLLVWVESKSPAPHVENARVYLENTFEVLL